MITIIQWCKIFLKMVIAKLCEIVRMFALHTLVLIPRHHNIAQRAYQYFLKHSLQIYCKCSNIKSSRSAVGNNMILQSSTPWRTFTLFTNITNFWSSFSLQFYKMFKNDKLHERAVKFTQFQTILVKYDLLLDI